MRWYAPQIKIPADILKVVGKQLHKLLKGKKKLVKRIGQIDSIMVEMSAQLDQLTGEREDLILKYADVIELVDRVNLYKKRGTLK
jgi:hypothetical protein